MLRSLAALLSLALAGAAHGADLSVQVRDAEGHPVADAVVMVRVVGGPGVTPGRFTSPMVMSQHGIAFDPHTLIVPVGSDVAFPNKDTVRHHVYSFSAAKKFELKLYGRDETRSVHFDKPGPVALGCNIHDRMAGFIYVVDTPYAAKTGANGIAVLKGLPTGPAELSVWHPYMKAPKNEVQRDVSPSGDMTEVVSAEFRAQPGKP